MPTRVCNKAFQSHEMRNFYDKVLVYFQTPFIILRHRQPMVTVCGIGLFPTPKVEVDGSEGDKGGRVDSCSGKKEEVHELGKGDDRA